MNLNRALLSAACLLVLTACADDLFNDTPAPAAAAPQPYMSPTMAEAGESVPVQPGDTVYSVARRYKVPMRDVIALNNFAAALLANHGLHACAARKTDHARTVCAPASCERKWW